MKKSVVLIISAALAFSLTACGSTGADTSSVTANSAATSSESTNTLDENEISRITTDGNKLTLMLQANPTTGYSWVADDAGSEMFKIEDDQYAENAHDEEMTGVGGTETFTISVLQSGTGGLIFEYKQDWDGGESDGKYNLNVTATEENGNVVIKDADFTKLDEGSNGDDGDTSSAQIVDYIPAVRIDGTVYQDTGYVSSAFGCGNMDGEITSTVDSSDMPKEDNQSNFGTGYGYQRWGDGLILVQMNEEMEIFRDINSTDTSIPDIVASFIGQVEKIDGNTILLKYIAMPEDSPCPAPDDGEYTASSSCVEGDVKAGDYVTVWYTGSIAETYPAQIDAYKIEKTEYTPSDSSAAS